MDARGARISEDDLELLLETVELAPDCNQLYTHAEQFAERLRRPLPALIARLVAAGLVEIDGPVLRVANPGMWLAQRLSPVALPNLAYTTGFIDGERTIEVPELRAHGALIHQYLENLPLAPRLRDTLVDYHQHWQRVRSSAVPIDGERCARFRAAINALLELRGLWPIDLGAPQDWELLELLSVAFPRDGATLRLDYYDWY